MAATVAEQLGYRPDDRLVILHADDLGLCAGSNQAFLELSDAGMVQCGSIMAPAPAAHAGLAHFAQRPDLDVGVHLTLTSEWPTLRWGPLTHPAPASLVDAAGLLWPSVQEMRAALWLEDVARELRAQIAWVQAAGVSISHLDTHMGACAVGELVELYADLGHEAHVPILAVQGQDAEMQRTGQQFELAYPPKLQARLAKYGLPPVDFMRVSPCYSDPTVSSPSPEIYERILGDLESGITFFALHPNAPGEIEQIDRVNHAWRIFEYHYFQSDRLDTFLRREGIVPIGYRAICAAMHAGFVTHA
jgi:predicted glycoside hydrolase/deacetylase ChbG (UPF0249 family)